MTAPAAAGPGRLTHLPGLDGLRGWAVAVVVGYHLGFLPGGFLGVDVFFVLSGFLVTSLLLSEAEAGSTTGPGGVSLRGFWGRRVRRLAPAILVVVPTVLLGAVVVGWPATQRGALAWDGVATLTWWANWRQAGGPSYWAGDPSPFRHAWSLSVEEQLYLLWPLLLVGAAAVAVRLGRSRRSVVGAVAGLGVAASTAWLVASTQGAGADLSRAYVGTDTRLATPLVGCVLACWWAPARRSSAGRGRAVGAVVGAAVLAALVGTVAVDDPWLYRRGGFLLAALATAAVVAGLATPAGGPAALRSVTTDPVSRYLGTRSYGLYLWSWPLQVLVAHRWDSLGRWGLAAVVVPTSLLLAEVSYRVVEDPIRRRQGWAARAPRRGPAWAAGVAGAVLAVAVVATSAEAPPVHERVDAARSARDAATRPPPTTVAPTTAPPADGGTVPVQEDLRVMVTGDSVAFTAVFHAPHDDLPPGIASIDGRGIIGCGVLSGDGWAYPSADGGGFTTERGTCELQRESEATGLSGAPHVVVAMPGAWEHSAARSPEGEVVEARSDRMGEVLVEALVRQARAADAVGAAYALVEWSCPGPEADAARRDDGYVRWFGEVQREVVRRAGAEGVRATLVRPTEDVCVGADPAGEQAPAWADATEGEVHTRHADGGRWLWHGWLGPALVAWLHGG